MPLATRHRWMLYGLAAAITAAAMVAVQPADEADDAPAIVEPRRSERPARGTEAVPELPRRPFSGAGRSPFGDAVAAGGGAAEPSGARPAPSPAPPPAPTRAAATETPFVFLGRWTEDGETTVFLAHGDQRLAARTGRPLTPEYRVESIGERELRVFHLPTRSRRTLPIAAGGAAPPPPGAAAAAAAPPEELN